MSEEPGMIDASTRSNSITSPRRVESLVSRASSRLVSALAKPAEEEKFARKTHMRYFGGSVPNYGDMSLEVKNVQIKALQTDTGTAVPRWTKHKGSLRVGVGQLHLLFKRPKKAIDHLLFDIGSIKEITMKNVHSKFFSVSFHNRPILLRLVFDSYNTCCNVVSNILHEAEFLASCFQKALLKKINPAWKKALRLDHFNDDIDFDPTAEVELTSEETASLAMDSSLLDQIEMILREEVDLNILGRGRANPETCDSMVRLGAFLRAVAKHDEGDFWMDTSESCREDYKERQREEALIGSNDKKKKNDAKGVDQLRLELKKDLGNLDYSNRLPIIERKLEEGPSQDSTAAAAQKDEFEALL